MHRHPASIPDGYTLGDLEPTVDNADIIIPIVRAADALVAAMRYAARAVDSWESRPEHLADLERGLDGLDALCGNLGIYGGTHGARRWLANAGRYPDAL